MQHDVLGAQADGIESVPVPKQGPSVAVNVGHESTVPVNLSQVYGLTHPKFPPHTHSLFHKYLRGYHRSHSESVLAV